MSDSVLQRKLSLRDILDGDSFGDVVKGFVELYRVGIKVFDVKGNKLADVKVGNGDFCGYVFSFPEGRRRCTATVTRVKDGPVAASHGARLPVLDSTIQSAPAGLIAVPCFTGLRYLIVPISWEGDSLGRVVFGPFLPEELKDFPSSLTEIDPGFDVAQGTEWVEKIRRAPESTIVRVMKHFLQVLHTMLFGGQKMFLTSQLHIEATLDSNRDLEERNKRLEETNTKLKELDRLKSAFLATVSHELRTPLTSIIGYSEMLSEGLAGPLAPEQHDYVKTIMEKGETLLKLISSILDISQIEAGKVRLNFDSMDVTELVSSAVSSIKPQAAKKGVTLETKIPPGMMRVIGDKDRLRQVFVNLLTNALKFTSRGGRIGVLVTEIGLQSEFNAQGYRVLIEDTGIGISGDQFEKIFNSFYQVDSSSTREFGGAGLGLSIVKSFVEGHGGLVRVESEVGQGSRFTVMLPIKPSAKSHAHIVPPVTMQHAPNDDRF
jgi:two-component system, NarL family, sensor histidine kinase BarA